MGFHFSIRHLRSIPDPLAREVPASFSSAAPGEGWVVAGVTYAGYNVVGAVIVLPVVRHLTSTAGCVCHTAADLRRLVALEEAPPGPNRTRNFAFRASPTWSLAHGRMLIRKHNCLASRRHFSVAGQSFSLALIHHIDYRVSAAFCRLHTQCLV